LKSGFKTQRELFGAGLPEGFRYRENVLTEAEEQTLAGQFAQLPFRPFEFHGYLGKRRIVSYGYRYDYGERALRDSAAFPEFLVSLRGKAAAIADLPADGFEQALVTEYAAGAGIGWHRDKPMFREVVAFSFLAPCVLRFRRKQGDTWDRRKWLLEPRSAYVLSGPARWEWYHSIPPVDALRYSVTFRNFVPERR
jgi:alkylated DNA repair dioxygenase AlkB